MSYSSCFFQAEDGIRDLVRSRGLGDVYKRQDEDKIREQLLVNMKTPKKKSKWQQRLEDIQKQQKAVKRR